MGYNSKGVEKDERLEWIKRNIEIEPFLRDRGWQLDKGGSTQQEKVLINPATGSKILVQVLPNKQGHYVWAHKKNPSDGDSLVGLLKNEGWDWKAIRELAQGVPLTPIHHLSNNHERPTLNKEVSPLEAKRKAQWKLDQIKPATGNDFLLTREINKETHISLQGMRVSEKEAGFGLYRNFTSEGKAELCSSIIYNISLEGRRAKYFQKGLDRGMSMLVEKGEKLSAVKRIVVSESPVDGLSYRQLEKVGNLHAGKSVGSTAFLSTCGSLTEQMKKDLGVVFKMAAEKNQAVVLAMDNDVAGREMTQVLAKIAKSAQCRYEIEVPSLGKDWNDQLVSKENNNQIHETTRKEENMENKIVPNQKEATKGQEINKGTVNEVDELLTPLHKAHSIGEAKKLLSEGADINAQDKYGNTPLHWSIFAGKQEVARYLIESRADVNIVGGKQRTPLHDAVLKENAEITKLLLEKGANLEARDREGRTPMELAEYKFETAVEVAQKHGYGHVIKAIEDHVEKENTVKSYTEVRQEYEELRDEGQMKRIYDPEWLRSADGLPTPAEIAFTSKMEVKALLEDVEKENTVKYEPTLEVLEKEMMEREKEDKMVPEEIKNVPEEVYEQDAFFEEHGITEQEYQDNQIAEFEEKMEERERYFPLHYAAEYGDLEKAKFLIEKGIDVNAKDQEGMTPLHLCANEFKGGGHSKEMAALLLEAGARIDEKNAFDLTPLHVAAWGAEKEVVELLVNHGADVNARGEDGRTPLHAAVHAHTSEVVDVLLKAGGDINAMDENGKTPLNWANNISGNKEVREAIIQEVERVSLGLAPKLSEGEGKKSFFGKMVDNFKEVFSSEKATMEVYEKEKHPLHHAAQVGDAKKVEELASQGADLNVQITADKSAKEVDIAFLKATMDGDTKKAREILGNNKDIHVNVQDMQKNAALHYAAIPVALKAIKGEGKEEDQAEKQAVTTPNLQVSSYGPSKESSLASTTDTLVKVAPKIEMKVDSIVPDFRLEIAEKVAFVQELLDRLAEPNIKNIEGKTPLHVAAMYGNTEVAKVLIQHGANLNIQDAKGNTPAHYAAEKNQKEMTSLLIEKGAKLDISNEVGRNVIQMAAASSKDFSHDEVIGTVYLAMQSQRPAQSMTKARSAGMSM